MVTLAALMLSAAISAENSGTRETTSLDELDWMAGAWGSTSEGVKAEEYWIAPEGGVMLGLHRDQFPSGKFFFEYLRIEVLEGRVVYIPSPGGQESVAFPVLELGEKRVVFSNPDHDFPQSIAYWLEDDRTLRCRVEGQGRDGERRVEEWSWKRQ